MSALTYTTAAVVIPPADARAAIQAIRRRYDRNARRWMPHITLLYPFYPLDAFAAAAPRLQAACASIAPFEVSLGAFGMFRQGRQDVLWLGPEPAAPLIALQEALWRAAPECDATRRHGGFTPHLTVGQSRERGATDAILSELRRTWTELRFTVESVALIWRADPPDDVFRVERELPLGG